MSNFPRPDLPTLISRVTQQIQVNLQSALLTPSLRRAVTVVVGKVLAQELYQEYAYLDVIADQFFTVTATGIYLDRKGNEVGIYREAGAAAAGTVTFSGPGGTVPAGAILQTLDQTQSFELSAAITLPGTTSGTVTALAQGAAGNLAAGTSLTLVTAVAGVTPTATVGTGGLTGGLDQETDADYRVRVLARQQQPPQGGAMRDYVAWAKLTPGVTRAWVYPLARGAGTVDVAAVFDARTSIIPTGTDITAIQAVLNTNRPVTASVNAITLSATTQNVVISNLVASTGYTKAQALANATTSLAELFGGATPGAATYGDGIQPGQTGGTIELEQISDAIAQSLGVATFDLTTPTADLTAGSEAILVLGTVTAP